MGNFIGHVLPGSFFFLYGCWVMYNVFQRYFLSQKNASVNHERSKSSHTMYRNANSYPFSCCPKVPVDGILKIVLVIVAIIGEITTAFRGGSFVNYENSHHMTMYYFFAISGTFDVLVVCGCRTPPDMDYITSILAFSVEGILFGFHLNGRTPMDIQVHTFLLYVIALCAISSGLEMLYKNNVMPGLMRAFGLLLQGTWFVQTAFILFKPLTSPWDQHGPRHMMLITLMFCWHIAGVFIIMLLAGWLIHSCVKRSSSTLHYYQLRDRMTKNDSSNQVNRMTPEEVRGIIEFSEEEV